MTNRERAEQFMDDVYTYAQPSNETVRVETDHLAREFDAVAQEAAAQMRERCATQIGLEAGWWEDNSEPHTASVVRKLAEGIRALPLTEEEAGHA